MFFARNRDCLNFLSVLYVGHTVWQKKTLYVNLSSQEAQRKMCARAVDC